MKLNLCVVGGAQSVCEAKTVFGITLNEKSVTYCHWIVWNGIWQRSNTKNNLSSKFSSVSLCVQPKRHFCSLIQSYTLMSSFHLKLKSFISVFRNCATTHLLTSFQNIWVKFTRNKITFWHFGHLHFNHVQNLCPSVLRIRPGLVVLYLVYSRCH